MRYFRPFMFAILFFSLVSVGHAGRQCVDLSLIEEDTLAWLAATRTAVSETVHDTFQRLVQDHLLVLAQERNRAELRENAEQFGKVSPEIQRQIKNLLLCGKKQCQ